mmetsp:Transcript_27298/g.55873  ORF Transcript_27298/g.55873 Transcript_27298/m.55873 type:complete len:348 (+) Transcript_27298:664-1707(+)
MFSPSSGNATGCSTLSTQKLSALCTLNRFKCRHSSGGRDQSSRVLVASLKSLHCGQRHDSACDSFSVTSKSLRHFSSVKPSAAAAESPSSPSPPPPASSVESSSLPTSSLSPASFPSLLLCSCLRLFLLLLSGFRFGGKISFSFASPHKKTRHSVRPPQSPISDQDSPELMSVLAALLPAAPAENADNGGGGGEESRVGSSQNSADSESLFFSASSASAATVSFFPMLGKLMSSPLPPLFLSPPPPPPQVAAASPSPPSSSSATSSPMRSLCWAPFEYADDEFATLLPSSSKSRDANTKRNGTAPLSVSAPCEFAAAWSTASRACACVKWEGTVSNNGSPTLTSLAA